MSSYIINQYRPRIKTSSDVRNSVFTLE